MATGTHDPAFVELCEEARRRIREATPEEVRDWQRSGEPLRLLDVREDHEWRAGHVEGAEHLGRGVLERDVGRVVPDGDTPIVLYCGGGYRSALAADALQRMGYRRVWSMSGGIRRWRELDLPTTDEA